ncbi:MAG: transporter substrate-binding domain-containing protein [Planctomycetota bacterium]
MKRPGSLAAAALALLCGGCSLFVRPQLGGEPKPKDERRAVDVAAIDSQKIAPGAQSSPYWAKVRAGGPLVVGVNEGYPPFGVTATVDKAKLGRPYVGFDVDLALHLGAALGVPVRLVGLRSRDVPDALNAGRIDVAIAGLTRTVYRAAQVAFTHPYLTISQGALIERRYVEGSRGTDEERRRDSFESYLDLASVPGLRIAAVENTRPYRLAVSTFPNAKVQAYPDLEAASAALIAGEADALVHDAPYIQAWPLLHASDAGRFRALLAPVTQEPISMAIRQGDLEFLRFLDTYVEEVKADGTVERLYRRHFVDGEWARWARPQTPEGKQ